MIEQRHTRIVDTLNRRQPDLTVVMDNVHKPHNLSAIARTCDGVGIGEMHAVVPEGSMRIGGKAASGTQKWIHVERWSRIGETFDVLRSRGFAIYTTVADSHALDYRTIDYTRPTALVVGAELDGVSNEAVQGADGVIEVPMRGMVESLNVSVAAGIVLYEAARQRDARGMYDRRRISETEFERLRFEWLHPSVAAHCHRHGLDFPELNAEGTIIGAISGNPRLGFGAINSVD